MYVGVYHPITQRNVFADQFATINKTILHRILSSKD